MLLHTLRQLSCEVSDLLTCVKLIFPMQRLLAITSIEPSLWATRNHLLFSYFLLSVCYRLRFHANMATAIRLSSATRAWDGDESIYDSRVCSRKFSCLNSWRTGHGLAAMGRFRNIHVSRGVVLFTGLLLMCGCTGASLRTLRCTRLEELLGVCSSDLHSSQLSH